MHFAFQDYDNLYLIMDLLNGGDLRYHISRYKKFSEKQTSIKIYKLEFFVACIVQGLEYIHANHIIHRDIKPENLVLDDMGNTVNKIRLCKDNRFWCSEKLSKRKFKRDQWNTRIHVS